MYSTGIADLRTLLSDGPSDRHNYQKRCFGQVNGANVNFKTFEARRVTNFTIAGTGGVFINSLIVPATGLLSDNPETGEFVLISAYAPADGGVVEASYYNQWFTDIELDTFLQISSRWLQGTSIYLNTADQFVDALQKYAAAEAYLKMAQRWRTYMSQGYKVEDAPKDSPTYNTKDFLAMSETMRSEALASRTEFMQTRQGRALQPLFGRIAGRVRNPV